MSTYRLNHNRKTRKIKKPKKNFQERGVQLYLRYASRWGRDAIRGLVDVTPLEPGRHCGQFQCPCQYIKEHLQCKPRGKFKCFNFVYWVLASERYD